MSSNYSQARDQILSLLANQWVDKETRAIFVTINIFNGNLNRFAVVRMFFELPLSGDFITYTNIETFPIPYGPIFDTAEHIVLVVLQLLVILYVILEFFVKEIREVYTQMIIKPKLTSEIDFFNPSKLQEHYTLFDKYLELVRVVHYFGITFF